LYLGRANLNPLVFAGSPPGGQLTLTTDVENFPGHVSIMGPDLIQKMRAQIQKFNVRIVDENILSVDLKHSPFELTVNPSAIKKLYGEKGEADAVIAQSVIVATGAKALWLDLESEQRLRGKGVSACATCDGFFFRGKVVAVIGGGDTAMEEALVLTRFASKVYLIHRRESFRASKIMQERVLNHPNIEVLWSTSVAEVLGQSKVESVRLQQSKGEKILPIDGLFLAIGHKPDTELFKDQLAMDEKGYLLTTQRRAMRLLHNLPEIGVWTPVSAEYEYMTSAEGVFAAGDNVDHLYRQAATAAGMGVAAALETEHWLDLQ
jgi:thioredoxin reductase (NADPH)